jgi:Zn-dependent protease
MKKSIPLIRIRGIQVNLHISWLIIFLLLAGSLSTGFFPSRYEFNSITNILLGVGSAILLFGSVIAHELSHSIVSKKNGIDVKSITLFFFGGLANIDDEPEDPNTELKIAIAGPALSILLGLVFLGIFSIAPGAELKAIFDYLFRVNFILAAFNLVPGFPLDGGRVFRALLWKKMGNIKRATKIASKGGAFFGYALIFFGLISIFLGIFGIWYILIGGFILILARSGYQQTLIKENLRNVKAEQLVHKDPLVKPDWTLKEFVEWCRTKQRSYGISKKQNYFMIDIDQVANVPKRSWGKMKVKDLMRKVNPVEISVKVFKIFRRMLKDNVEALVVVDDNKYCGVIDLAAIRNYLRVNSL